MVSIPSTSSSNVPNSYSAKGICQIVGLACLIGFLIDMLVISLPPAAGNLEWRAAVMQQLSDRSIILLLGAALLLFGGIDHRRWVKRFCTACLIFGILFCVSSLLVIADTLALHQQAIAQISAQESQIKTQINNAQANPRALGANVTTADLQKAIQQLGTQAQAAKINAKTSTVKLGAASIGNLVVVGLGLVSLGRFGMRLRTR